MVFNSSTSVATSSPMLGGKRRGRKPGLNSTVAQRSAANARERSRMRVLSTAFVELKGALPWVPKDTKLSKLDTLKLAATYIAHLQSILDSSGASATRMLHHHSNLSPPVARKMDNFEVHADDDRGCHGDQTTVHLLDLVAGCKFGSRGGVAPATDLPRPPPLPGQGQTCLFAGLEPSQPSGGMANRVEHFRPDGTFNYHDCQSSAAVISPNPFPPTVFGSDSIHEMQQRKLNCGESTTVKSMCKSNGDIEIDSSTTESYDESMPIPRNDAGTLHAMNSWQSIHPNRSLFNADLDRDTSPCEAGFFDCDQLTKKPLLVPIDETQSRLALPGFPDNSQLRSVSKLAETSAPFDFISNYPYRDRDDMTKNLPSVVQGYYNHHCSALFANATFHASVHSNSSCLPACSRTTQPSGLENSFRSHEQT